jgi:predicted nucleic acid-binding protein
VNRVFVDTSAWLALLDRTSRHHRAVAAAVRAWDGRLATSNFILDEALTFARHRLGWNVARSFGDEMRAGQLAFLVAVEPGDEDAAWDIFVRFHDHVFSFTDCTSFALMRRLRLDTAVSLDADFRAFGLRCLP